MSSVPPPPPGPRPRSPPKLPSPNETPGAATTASTLTATATAGSKPRTPVSPVEEENSPTDSPKTVPLTKEQEEEIRKKAEEDEKKKKAAEEEARKKAEEEANRPCYEKVGRACLPDACFADAPYIFEEGSETLAMWDAFIIFTTTLIMILIPVRIGFLLTSNNEWLALDLICDVTYIIDIVIRTRRTFYDHGEPVKDVLAIHEHYVYTWEFVVDVFSVLPIDLIAIAFPENRAAFLANRLLRMHRPVAALGRWTMSSSIKPSLITMIRSLTLFYYVVHVDGSVKNLVLVLQNNQDDLRFMTSSGYFQDHFWGRFFRSWYLSLVAASGFASSTPTTVIECLVSIFDCVVSIAVFGVIIGVFGSLVANLDASRIYFFHKLDDANEYMKTQKLNRKLVDDVNSYYRYLWNSGQALEKNQVLQMLPTSIRHKISYHVTSSFIKKVPFFEEITKEEFFIEICKNLMPRTALPDTYVVKKGEMGTEMFFVLRGELNVVADVPVMIPATETTPATPLLNEDGSPKMKTIVVHTFTTGGFFGEIAIMYQIKRTATIIARTYCDIYVLGKTEFSKVLKKYPIESKSIRAVAKARFEIINAGDKSKKEAELKQKEEDLAAATRRAEQVAAENNIADVLSSGSAESQDLGSDSDRDNNDEKNTNTRSTNSNNNNDNENSHHPNSSGNDAAAAGAAPAGARRRSSILEDVLKSTTPDALGNLLAKAQRGGAGPMATMMSPTAGSDNNTPMMHRPSAAAAAVGDSAPTPAGQQNRN